MLLAISISIVIPLACLYALNGLDSAASARHDLVLMALGAGLLTFTGAYGLNSAAGLLFSLSTITLLIAPILEETLKLLGMRYVLYKSSYVVDGVVAGFGAGIAFALVENILYLSSNPTLGLGLSRAFSTALMHGTTNALLGVTVTRTGLRVGTARWLILLLGWGGTVVLHSAFNHLVNKPLDALLLLQSVLVGLGGLVLTGGLMIAGLREARAKLHLLLSAPPMQLDRWQFLDGEQLCAEAARRFGQRHARLLERLLYLDAERDLKQLAADCAAHPPLRAQLGQELVQLDGQLEELQAVLGVYVMTYARTIILPEVVPLWHHAHKVMRQRYHLQMTLHSGPSGVTFLARDLHLNRNVVVFILAPLLETPIARQILISARELAPLQSPQIVTIYDCYAQDGLAFVVREYVEGQTLREALDDGHRPELQTIALDILRALEYAHSRGIYHGALRPEVILLLGQGAKVCDFGLHRMLHQPSISMNPPPHLLPYLAPEQLSHEPITAQTDLYALGLIIYELATGQHPFCATDREALTQQQADPVRPGQTNQQLSRSLDYLIMKLLAPRPEERYSSATEVSRVLLSLETSPTAVALPLAAQRRPLIGREAHLQRLMQHWNTACQRQGQIVLIAGEAGIGKSRLLAACTAQAHGATLLVGQAAEEQHQAPYHLVMMLIETYLSNTPSERLQQQIDVSLAPLSTLIPALTPYTGPWINPPATTPEQAQLRLRRSMVHFIELIAQHGPCLLLLENLHWADPASLEVLRALAPRVVQTPLLILGTYRDLDLDEAHPLRQVLRGLSRFPTFHPIALSRLDEAQVGQLLTALWQQAPPEPWVSAIYGRTGGNPLYVEEVATALVDAGSAAYRDGRWHFAELSTIALPQSVCEIVRSRLLLLSPPTLDLLRWAAVLGHQFSFEQLMIAIKQPETMLLQQLDEALGRQLIIEDAHGLSFHFAQAEIQQVIYDDLSAVRRRFFHAHLAQQMEDHSTGENETTARQLAYHFLQAGNAEKALHYTLQAAQYAQAVQAYASAQQWYTHALQLVPDTAQAAQQRVEIYGKLGAMCARQALYTKAAEAYEAMAHQAECCNHTRARIQAYTGLAYIQERRGAYHSSLESARQAVTLAQTLGETLDGELAAARFYEGWACYRLGDAVQADLLAEEAHALCLALGAPARRELALCLKLRGALAIVFGNFEQAAIYKEQALAIVRELRDQREEAILLSNLGYLATKWGKYEQALVAYNQALALARLIDYRGGELLTLCNMAWPKIRLGIYDSAEADLRQVLLLAEPEWFSLSDAYRALSEACLGQDKLHEALHAGQQALRLAEQSKRPEVVVGAWRTLGRIAGKQDSPVLVGEEGYDARACFAESLRISAAHQLRTEQTHTLHAWAKYEFTQGEHQRGMQLREQAQVLQMHS